MVFKVSQLDLMSGGFLMKIKQYFGNRLIAIKIVTYSLQTFTHDMEGKTI